MTIQTCGTSKRPCWVISDSGQTLYAYARTVAKYPERCERKLGEFYIDFHAGHCWERRVEFGHAFMELGRALA